MDILHASFSESCHRLYSASCSSCETDAVHRRQTARQGATARTLTCRISSPGLWMLISVSRYGPVWEMSVSPYHFCLQFIDFNRQLLLASPKCRQIHAETDKRKRDRDPERVIASKESTLMNAPKNSANLQRIYFSMHGLCVLWFRIDFCLDFWMQTELEVFTQVWLWHWKGGHLSRPSGHGCFCAITSFKENSPNVRLQFGSFESEPAASCSTQFVLFSLPGPHLWQWTCKQPRTVFSNSPRHSQPQITPHC